MGIQMYVINRNGVGKLEVVTHHLRDEKDPTLRLNFIYEIELDSKDQTNLEGLHQLNT